VGGTKCPRREGAMAIDSLFSCKRERGFKRQLKFRLETIPLTLRLALILYNLLVVFPDLVVESLRKKCVIFPTQIKKGLVPFFLCIFDLKWNETTR
jgi:hypothetical protein